MGGGSEKVRVVLMVCKICDDGELKATVLNGLTEGLSFADLSKGTGIAINTLRKHAQQCIPRQLAKAQSARDLKEGDNLIKRMDYLWDKAVAQIEGAERDTKMDRAAVRKQLEKLPKDQQDMIMGLANTIAADRRDVLAGVNSARQVVELIGKLRGDIKQDQITYVYASPSFQSMLQAILGALQHHREVHDLVKDALAEWSDAQTIEHDPNGQIHLG